jgi:UDP-N-acetylglucosamine 2-epimerase
LKIVTIVGARPQFIKAALLVREFSHRGIEHCLVHTGQHYDFEMSQVFFDQLGLPRPDYNLGVGSASHAVQTAEMMRGLEPVLETERPRYVVVFGDTNSTLAGALTAVKLRLPVVHVEAGLRSFNRSLPEEINRVVADHVSSVLCAPSERAATQLAAEGVRAGVYVVGDLMLDLLAGVRDSMPARPSILERFELQPGTYVLATIHRPANTDDPHAFADIVSGLRRLRLPVIFPVHPRTAALVQAFEVGGPGDTITPIEPLPYEETIALARFARVVVTDSGGLQKESVMLGVPCVTLRDETEWNETLDDGWNALAGTDPGAIERLALRPRPLTPSRAFVADGGCASRIVDLLAASDVHRGRTYSINRDRSDTYSAKARSPVSPAAADAR